MKSNYAYVVMFVLLLSSVSVLATSVGTPLTDLGTGLYIGEFEGGLYPGGVNDMPPEHFNAGLVLASQIQPLDASGSPDPTGSIGFIAIGMSNTALHFEGFMSEVKEDPALSEFIVISQTAQDSRSAKEWVDPLSRTYDRADTILARDGLSPEQVQVAWILQANPNPELSLPHEDADAFVLEEHLASTLRTLRVRYPHLKQVFFSSRMYSCSQTGLNPEPYAYESGFSVKWLIESQINQMMTSSVDNRVGDLSYESGTAPWIAWGPYLWANGSSVRSDGLSWERSDLENDCVHPTTSGVLKSARVMADFFKTSPHTTEWFVSENCRELSECERIHDDTDDVDDEVFSFRAIIQAVKAWFSFSPR